MPTADPDTISWARFALASVTVLALMAGLAWGLKLLALRGWMKTGAGQNRIRILSSFALDAKRRLLLVRHDETEHLLLLGQTGDLLLSSKPAAPDTSNETQQTGCRMRGHDKR